MGVIVGLVGFSYQRLSALAELASWAAPYLARRGEGPRAQAGSLELRREMAELNEATLDPRRSCRWINADPSHLR